MTAIRFVASVVLGLVATTSAFAAEPGAAPTPTASPAVTTSTASSAVTLAAGPAAVAYKASPDARYCFRTEQTTGSMISKRICKNRSQWQAMGVDLDRALAGR